MKLRKIVKVGATVQYEQSYLGGLEYRKNGTGSTRVEAVYHAEGRYLNLNAEVNNTLLWQKEYTLKDHLGNARISFTDKNANGIVDVPSDIIQENHYYPFGLNYEGAWRMNDAARDNKYQYNGKEWNDDFGLNWNDYGARWYMPDIGRWGTIDPLAGAYLSLSPYNFVANNPLMFIDPDGTYLDLTLGENGAKALESFKKVADRGLEGQFEVKFQKLKDGKYRVNIIATKNGGKVKELSKEAGNFYKHLSKVTTDKEVVVNQTLVYGKYGIDIGKYGTGELDMADVEQFGQGGIGTDYSAPTGALQQGKLIHEVVEQYEKSKEGYTHDGSNDGYGVAHSRAIKAEDSVNGNTRLDDRTTLTMGNRAIQQEYLEKNGTISYLIYKFSPTIHIYRNTKPRALPKDKKNK